MKYMVYSIRYVGMDTNAQSIQKYWLEIKAFGEELMRQWGMVAVVALVGIGSFGLGRLSVLYASKPPIEIYAAAEAAAPKGLYLGGQFIASKTGSVYYFPWCGGALAIPASEQVWFNSAAAAEKAGYTAAKNCKGMEN